MERNYFKCVFLYYIWACLIIKIIQTNRKYYDYVIISFISVIKKCMYISLNIYNLNSYHWELKCIDLTPLKEKNNLYNSS